MGPQPSAFYIMYDLLLHTYGLFRSFDSSLYVEQDSDAAGTMSLDIM